MRRLRSLVLITCALALPLVAARAQDSTTSTRPPVGARVLVTFPKADGYEPGALPWTPVLSPRFVGRVVHVTSESLYVQPHPSASAVAVPRGAVQHVYVSGGRPRARAMAWGALNGTLLGISLGEAVYGDWLMHDGSSGRRRLDVWAQYAASGALAGVVLGAIWPGERWRRLR